MIGDDIIIKIMIVEDDINIAEGIDAIIKSRHYNVKTTITGYSEKALEYALIHKYDMFFLDINLLDYSGLELGKQIRIIDKYKLTPIVFITAIPTSELLAFKKIHCYDYILKPFKEDEVTNLLDTIINYGIKKENKQEYISFNLKDYIYRVQLNDIIYFESIQRKIKVGSIKEDINLSSYTLYDLETMLNYDFIRCHKSYIVNTNYICKVDKTNNLIELDNSDILIPIGRKYRDNLRGAVNEYN